MEKPQREDAAEVGAETTAPPARMEALPHIARQLYDAVLRISQVEAQQLRDVEVRMGQAEEALSQALQALQAVRAEQWKMMRNVAQSVGELLQASGQLLQLLLGESHKSSEPRRVAPWREPPHPPPDTGQPPPQT